MKTIKVGGVPEHFNLPWHLCHEASAFEEAGVNVIWKDFPEGTGAMSRALRNGEIDVAVILTEGIIRDILAGNDSRIVQTYIGSPLIWGIHVAAGSPYQSVEALKGTRAAISRKGSGSHLMAFVNAQNHRWNTRELAFDVVDDINGAVTALKEDRAQYFMWEHFTTKPLVDDHTFRRLADCPTPWPCFVIAVRNAALRTDRARIKTMLEVLNRETVGFKQRPGITGELSRRYGQREEDIQQWLKVTRWSQDQLAHQELHKVQEKLMELDLIPQKGKTEDLLVNL